MTYHNIDNIFSGDFFNESLLSFSNLIEFDKNDLFSNEEDDKRYYIFNEYISQDTNIKPSMNPNYIFEEKTRDITDKRLKNLIENNNGKAPPFFSLNLISELLPQNGGYNKRLIDMIIKDENKLLVLKLSPKQNVNSTMKKSSNNYQVQNDNIFKEENFIDLENEEVKKKDNYLQKKRGRKKNKKDGKVHNRYDADNIIKKIKAQIFDYCLKFLNKLIYKNGEESIKLLKINYKHIDQLEKKKNLVLFEMSLSDIFSLDVSSKYSSKKEDYNKVLISGILEKEIEVEDFDTIMFLFKITLNDWIDLFTYKTDILTLINEYNASNVNYNKIQNNFIGVNHLLNKISEKNDCKYYTLFLLYIFNFQRWFYIKRGRILKKKGE
jgi:hypothetical protein